MAAQQAWLDYINHSPDVAEGGCPGSFQNSTIVTKEITGDSLNMHYSPGNFPSMFENATKTAVWRLVDVSGYVKDWTVTLQPAGQSVGTSKNGTVEFSLSAVKGDGEPDMTLSSFGGRKLTRIPNS